MLDRLKLTGADVSVGFYERHLQSLYILSSGPLYCGVEGMIKGHEAGAGTVVTKIIHLETAIDPVYHTGTVNQDSLINCEKWADSDRLSWYENEIPKTIAAGAVTINSVGRALKEAQATIKDVERAGAHVIELVSYTRDTLIPMLDYTKTRVDVLVTCKLSGNWPDTVGTTRKCLEHGANGIYAIDSIGSTLKIDIKKIAPKMMSGDGFGQMIGVAVRSAAMRYNYRIARKNSQLMNLYAFDGVMRVDDAIEYMMAGAMGIGVYTIGIPEGVECVEKIYYDLSRHLAKLGYGSIWEVNRTVYSNFPSEEHTSGLRFHSTPFKEDGATKKCVSYEKCETVCCYDVRKPTSPEMTVDMGECRCCGPCLDVCPTGTLAAGPAPQTEKGLALAQKSRNFYELVKQ